jgi:hypothetical protein
VLSVPPAAYGWCSTAQSIIPYHFGSQKLYAIDLAQTSKHLSVSGAAGDSHLFRGSDIHERWRRRKLDHSGFPRAIDVILSSIAVLAFPKSGVLPNRGVRDSARHRRRRLRKAAARKGHLYSPSNLNREIAERVVLITRWYV